ncbi:hypothetical protein ARMGADRAFT_1020718 [Armillaria gallica]|uniref:Uncharacterized protein n=1 Tax=Armillaria gallica TaxID=47427 RepID=A0A2H3CX71_ARMGA|nr:hypothetical protein ARMGADRAFT_1020718 [Armillaria gallica]
MSQVQVAYSSVTGDAQTVALCQCGGNGKLNFSAGDSEGELDAHDADGNGNTVGVLVFSTAFQTGVCMDVLHVGRPALP